MTAIRTKSGKPIAPPGDDAKHILIVDDDQRIRDLITRYLFENGFRTSSARDVAAARASMRGLAFDLVILDVMMPGESGLTFARDLRKSTDLPILMLTARGGPDDRIEGLEIGVDDYLAKPFEPRELLLRIANILRRRDDAEPITEEVNFGELVFHIVRGELKKGKKSLKLTERERHLLRQFAQRPGDIIPRHELYGSEVTGSERAIDVQINRLRRKIEIDPSSPVYLQTVRGKGYILYID